MTLFGNSLYQWAGLIVILVLALVFNRVIFWRLSGTLHSLTKPSNPDILDRLMRSLEQPIFVLSLLGGVWLGVGLLSLSFELRDLILRIWQFLFTCSVAWALVRVYDYLHDMYILPRLGQQLGAEFLSALKSMVKGLVWALGVLVALNNAGYDVTTILASLGILGLAVALAAQDTVANLFGGVALFTQQPFRVGDRIKVADVDGWIRQVGFRNTKMEDIFGQEILIPNRYFSENPVRNISSRTAYVVSGIIPLSQTIDPATLEQFLEYMRNLLNTHPQLTGHRYVGVKGFGTVSIDVECWFEVKKLDEAEKQAYPDEYAKIVAVRSEVYLQALHEMKTLGVSLALPAAQLVEWK